MLFFQKKKNYRLKQVIKDRQTITDISVQTSGSPESALEIAWMNGYSLTEDVDTGNVVSVPEAINKRKAAMYARENMQPAMRAPKDGSRPGGIGYMQIGTDFKIS